MKHLLAVIIIMTAGFGSHARADWDDAVEAHDSGNYKEAFNEFKSLAEEGSARAQSRVGFMYHVGEGIQQNYDEAVTWYRRAVEQGYSTAQLNLGVMYSKGEGVPKDKVQALMWFDLAAAQGSKLADANRGNVAEMMSREEIMEAKRLAEEWRAEHQKPE